MIDERHASVRKNERLHLDEMLSQSILSCDMAAILLFAREIDEGEKIVSVFKIFACGQLKMIHLSISRMRDWLFTSACLFTRQFRLAARKCCNMIENKVEKKQTERWVNEVEAKAMFVHD